MGLNNMYLIRCAMLWMLAVCCWVRPALAEPPLKAAVETAAQNTDAPLAGPFADAQFVPGDVKFFLHVSDAANLRRKIAAQPIADLFHTLIGGEKLRAAWSDLATLSKLSDAELFDTLLGGEFTLASRPGSGENVQQWAIITDVAPETMISLRRAWRVQRQLPRHGFAMALLPEQDILLAERDRTIIIGPRGESALFDIILAGQSRKLSSSLAQSEQFAERAGALGDGGCALYITNGESVGGSSLFVADLNGRSVHLRQAARFRQPPFERQTTKLQCDYSLVRNFERDQLATIMEPADLGPTRLESFTYELLGDTVGARELQNAAGNRRILTFGEEEGRLRDVPDDVLAPVPAVVIEMDGDKYTIAQLDVRMTRIASVLNDMNDGAMLINVPPAHVYKQGHDRRIDVSTAVDAFAGGFPIMKNVSLNWDIVNGESGTWCVIAGSPHQLQSVVTSLGTPCTSEARLVGTFDSVGSINGARVGEHLLSWKAVAGQLAPAGEQQEFAQAIDLLSQLTGGADRICWQMRRPARDEMLLDMQIKLRESPSTSTHPVPGDN